MPGLHDDLTNGVALVVDEIDVFAITDIPARAAELFVNDLSGLRLCGELVVHLEVVGTKPHPQVPPPRDRLGEPGGRGIL